MEILSRIIHSMNKEEVRHFKLYSSRYQLSAERKDLALFRMMQELRNPEEEEEIIRKLYQNNDRNAYYRLKNKLLEDLEKSQNLLHFRNDETVRIFHLLSFAILQRQKTNYEVASYFIRKAERKALAAENYELLDLIYGELIRLSRDLVDINPEVYIRRRKENRDKLNFLREMDDILTAITFRLKVSNFSSRDKSLLQMLEKTIDEFSSDPRTREIPRVRFNIYQAVSQVLLQKLEYPLLEEYIVRTFEEFSNDQLFNQTNHGVKLQMLAWTVNVLFKNRKFKLSLDYAGRLHEAMEEFNRLYYLNYLVFYYNSLVINYTHLNKKNEAIKLLEELQDNKVLKNTPFYAVLIYGNLAVLWFTQRRFDLAIKNLTRLFIHKGFRGIDEILRLRFAIAELIIRFEKEEFDLIERRIEAVRREFKNLLVLPENQREKDLLPVIKEMMVTSEIKSSSLLAKKITALINLKPGFEPGDNEIINYNVWLRSRLEKKYYDDVLSAVVVPAG